MGLSLAQTTIVPSARTATPVWRWLGLAALLAMALAAPFALESYRLFQVTMVLIYAVVLLGLNILTGYNGQISLGHGAFFAVGAYTAAILLDETAVPYWLAIPTAGAVCFAGGVCFGLPALRLRGHYLALATFALAVATPQTLKYRHLQDWTGGVQGLLVTKPDAPAGIALDADQWLYVVVLAVTVAMFAAGWNMLRGRTGLALMAIRDNPVAAAAMGIDTARYKTQAFGVSAMYAGVGGALSALAVQFVSPDSFTFLLSISFLVGVVVGGLASLSGALFGAVFIQFVPNLAEEVSKAAPWAIYGAVLLAFIYLLPQGIVGLPAMLRTRGTSSPPSPNGRPPSMS